MSITPIGPGSPFTLLFTEDQATTPSLPEAFRAIYGGDWHIPPSTGRPYTYSNFAAGRDGRVSYNEPGISSGGEVTNFNAHDRWLMGLLRARADAVMTGDGTLKIEPEHHWTAEFIYPGEEAAFTALRQAEKRSGPPKLVIVSYAGDLNAKSFCFQQPDLHIIVATTTHGYEQVKDIECTAQLDVHQLGADWVDLAQLSQMLYSDYNVRALLCEGGPRLMGGMLNAGLIDEEFLTYCPRFVGETKEKFRPSYVEGVAFQPETAPYSRPYSLRRAGDFLFLQTRCTYTGDSR
ncbi:MAG: dihydrofolate reductase family protein [Chloroflexi bacterium]|nr:dihydrofolate reductase family protein [Chloroflexota bacterium]